MPMNVKEVDIFFVDQLAIVYPKVGILFCFAPNPKF